MPVVNHSTIALFDLEQKNSCKHTTSYLLTLESSRCMRCILYSRELVLIGFGLTNEFSEKTFMTLSRFIYVLHSILAKMQDHEKVFRKAAGDALAEPYGPLVDVNMNTNEAADYILSHHKQFFAEAPNYPKSQTQERRAVPTDSLDESDDFDKSLSASLEQKKAQGQRTTAQDLGDSESKQSTLRQIELPKPYFREDSGALQIYQQFLHKMDEYFASYQQQNQRQNEQFYQLIAKKSFDEEKLYHFLDLKLSQANQQYSVAAAVPQLASSKQYEVMAPEREATKARDMFSSELPRKHEVVREEDPLHVYKEGFKRAQVETKDRSVQNSGVEEIVLQQKRHRKSRHRKEKATQKTVYERPVNCPFYPQQFYPMQFAFPYVPFCGCWAYTYPHGAQQTEHSTPRPQLANEFTSYHEQENTRKRQQRYAAETPKDQSQHSAGSLHYGQATKEPEQQKPYCYAVYEYVQPQKQLRPPETPSQPSINNSPYSHTSLGEIFPKYDAKQAELLCKKGVGIGAYDTSVFSDWNLSDLYSSQLSEGEMRRNFAYVQNYGAPK